MATAAYTAGYRPYAFGDFSGGLNLRDKADTVGDREAIDLLNVTFTERGAIAQRDGFADFTPTDLPQRVDSLSEFYTASGLRQLIAGCGTRLDALDTAGAIVGSRTGQAGGPWSFARFGDPLHEYLYAANGANVLQRWDGAAWADGAALATVNGNPGQSMPRAGSVTVGAQQAGTTSGNNAANRLVATAFGTQTDAGPGGAVTSPSHVYYSNPGQPEVWETDGFVGPPGRGRNFSVLTPGDGEQIMAAVTWRELVFIFKETKFFVLWGEGVGSDNNPTFQVREVVNGVGLRSKLGVTVGRDGVYFFNRRGVYRTTGGDPVLLSDVISPLWTAAPELYYQGEPINLGQLHLVRMCWFMEQLFVAIPTGSSAFNDRLLVYDTQHNWWTVYDIPASALAPFRRLDRTELHHGDSYGPRRVAHRAYGSTTDRGQRIVSRWRSGWSDYETSQVKTIRENKVWGTGACAISFSIDFERALTHPIDMSFGDVGRWPSFAWRYQDLTARGASYALLATQYTNYHDLTVNDPIVGSATDIMSWTEWLAQYSGRWPTDQVGNLLVRRAVRGTLFSTQFANSPQAETWGVQRITRHLREIREPSIR